MGSTTLAAPLPVMSPTGDIVEMTDVNGLVLCQNCGRCWTWATRPHLPTPCVTAHRLVDGTALLHWTMERLSGIFSDYIEGIACGEEASYPGLSERFQHRIDDLRDEMAVRFGPKAHLWHGHAVGVATKQVTAWMELECGEARSHV